VKAVRDIILTKNMHVTVLSSAGPAFLPRGTEAEIRAIGPTHIEINCKDGFGHGPTAWGLKIKIAKVIWGISFE
jgi:hypothetical protein